MHLYHAPCHLEIHIGGQSGKCYSHEVMCHSVNIQVFKWQVFHISKGYGQVMNSNPSFSFASRIQESTLYVDMGSVPPRTSVRILIYDIVLLNFISYDSIRVDNRTENKVLSFRLDLNVTERVDLLETERDTNSEDTFPCCTSCQVVIQLIRKFETKRSRRELRIVVQIPA